jgi:CBS domain-containing protein
MKDLSVTTFDQEIGDLGLLSLDYLSATAPLSEAIDYFSSNESSILAIGTETDLKGILTEWDVVHQFSPNIDSKDVKAVDLCIDDPVILEATNTLYEVMNKMSRRNFSSFPVKDANGNINKVFSTQVFFKFLYNNFKEFFEKLGCLENWDPTKSIQTFSEDFNYSVSMEDDSSLHQNYFLTPFERIPCSAMVKLDEEVKVKDAWEILLEKECDNLIITKFGTKLVGILTLKDLITKILVSEGEIDINLPVKNFMTKNPDSLMYKHPIGHAINHFDKFKYRQVIIVDEDRVPIKVVSLLEIFSHLIARLKLN